MHIIPLDSIYKPKSGDETGLLSCKELEEVKTLDCLKCVATDGKVLNSGMAHPVIKVYR